MALVKTMKWFVIACLVVACGELDPVSVKSMCVGDGVWNEQCPQCQSMPFASQCPQCQQSGLEEGVCSTETSSNMIGQPTGDGGTATNADAQLGPDGTPQSDSGANNANAGSSGSGSDNMAAAGRTPPPGTAGADASGQTPPQKPGQQEPARCADDSGCTEEGRPACRPDGLCTECVLDKHCPGRQCEVSTNLCVECIDDPICQTQGKVCNREARKCVQCRDDMQCGGATPACSPTQECVPCLNDAHCPDETPACDQMTCYECKFDQHCNGEGKHACIEAEHKCVECETETHCRGVAGRPHCATEENRCVECLEDSDCSDRSASHCDTDSHTCVPCSSHTHCAAFAGTAPRCVEGGCVACDEDGGICNGKACILSQNICSSKQRQSVQACGECVTSDECVAGHVCVNVKFSNGYDTGDFCLPALPDFKACPRPFGRKVSGAVTLDGRRVQTLCSLPETTTCQALLDTLAKKSCMDNNAACGLGRPTLGVNDGVCSANGLCTYNCPSAESCPNSMICSQEQSVCL